ncbi:hypothetical protein [Alkalihalobacillus pseudalcaliphilus]|uniref:hypothetical protein n=1 Tax=Alkalihalobacillus pseudalcaliphilus TaxID=79884 RepID=UPI00064D973F|nr:hypothetical protein [Alkalihalobacillus pseudalcaliphilus]KMK76474.1 hypothetical protein AB990_14925 [Alkalihalobacillus pseudalcaliphilus]
MNLQKITNKSLITNADLSFSQRFGLPIEVCCCKTSETLAFGQIQDFNDRFIMVADRLFQRDSNLFFGNRHLTA